MQSRRTPPSRSLPLPQPPSAPRGREIYLTFNHLHKNLVPVIDESEDSEEERPRKKEAWRKRFHLPDYRKVKIGEYYDEDLDVGCCSAEGESDSARSSFESDKSIEGKTAAPNPPVICSGCNHNFTSPPTPPITESTSSAYGLKRQDSRSRKLRIQTVPHTRYRCLWPGCRILLCAICTDLMKRPKSSGGMGGSLPELQSYWEQQKNAELPKSNASEAASKSDGSITADIVQAATSASTSPMRQMKNISEMINAVDHTVAIVESKLVEKAVAGSARRESTQKLGTVGHKEREDNSNTNNVHSIVVTVKELGLVAPEVKAS